MAPQWDPAHRTMTPVGPWRPILWSVRRAGPWACACAGVGLCRAPPCPILNDRRALTVAPIVFFWPESPFCVLVESGGAATGIAAGDAWGFVSRLSTLQERDCVWGTLFDCSELRRKGEAFDAPDGLLVGWARSRPEGLGQSTMPLHEDATRTVIHKSPPPSPVIKSSGGSVDTTKTHSDPQSVRVSSGERPIGAVEGKQSDTKALCHPPPPHCVSYGPCPSYSRRRDRNNFV